MKYPCPCCGYLTLPYPVSAAVAAICPVCFWENDVFDPGQDTSSDENHGMTLRQGRSNFQALGAVRKDFCAHVRPPLPEEVPPALPDLIRPVRKSDYPGVFQLVRTAFQTAKVTDGCEQNFVDALRRRDTYLPQLELVAELNGQLTGHIMLTELPVPEQDSQKRFLMLAPLCVRLEDRGRGLGGALIREATQRAVGYSAVFLMGDPAYYGRFGFQNAVQYGFQNASGVPDQYLLVLELDFALPRHAGGKIDLH